MRRSLPTPPDFAFGSAVCSHGFFVLAPNRWDAAARTLHTAVALDEDRAAAVSIREQSPHRLGVRVDASLFGDQTDAVVAAVRRILRLDEDLSPFHVLCRRRPSHRRAAMSRFGRLLRSESFFEDLVKVICTCNVGWGQTVGMIERIVAHWGIPTTDGCARSFPTPDRLARASVADLRRLARVGYRAPFIRDAARAVAEGSLDLIALEHFDGPADERYRRLRAIRGVGDYAASHLCMLAGDYTRLAVDTEMVRLLRARYPRTRLTPARIRDLYRPWHPYEYLAYWYELWSDYVRRHGQSDQWSAADQGTRITSRRRSTGTSASDGG